MSFTLRSKWGNVFGHKSLPIQDIAAYLGQGIYVRALEDTSSIVDSVLEYRKTQDPSFLECLRYFAAFYLRIVITRFQANYERTEIITEVSTLLQIAHTIIVNSSKFDALAFSVTSPRHDPLLPADFVFSSQSPKPPVDISTAFAAKLTKIIPPRENAALDATVVSLHVTSCAKLLKLIDDMPSIQLPYKPLFAEHRTKK